MFLDTRRQTPKLGRNFVSLNYSLDPAGTGGTFGTELFLRNGTVNVPFREN